MAESNVFQTYQRLALKKKYALPKTTILVDPLNLHKVSSLGELNWYRD